MRAGRLRNLCIFKELADGDDGYGNTKGGWTEKCRAWGRILEQTGREALEAGRLEGQSAARLWVRANSDTRLITAADIVVVKGETWQVKTPASEANKNNELEFVLVRGTAS